jgi:CBS domain-containing protein
MRDSGLRTLPVVKDGKLAGMINVKQIMRVTSTRSNITVAGLMMPSRLVSTPEESLDKIARDILSFEVSMAPVVRSISDQTIVGVVRLDDILHYIKKAPHSSKLTLAEIMSKKVVWCTPDDDISRVWKLMEETKYSGLPVTRYNKVRHITEVIGMITRSDIIRSGATRLGEESDKGRFRHPSRVKQIMHTPPIVGTPNMPVAEAIELMLKHDIGRLPVVDNGALVGIVSRSDIVKEWLRR